MHEANQVLKQRFTENSVLNTPEKNYIVRLGQKAERLQARVTVLLERNKQNKEMLAARNACKSGRRVSIEGNHFLTARDV